MAHDGRPAVTALAFADQLIAVPVSVPVAVPETFKSPAQDALNDPLADEGVCCVGFHLKSVHVEGDGITLALVEAQLPISAATPVEEGPVTDDLLE
jgi:hypothetical protein